jgi:hypothetical protein
MANYNATKVAANLNLAPTFSSWEEVVASLNTIPIPDDHVAQNACSQPTSQGKINCRHPGSLTAGVPRVLMPEISEEVVRNMTLIPERRKMKVSEFIESYVAQREIDLAKIEKTAQAHIDKGFNILNNTFYLSTESDGSHVVIDGHHGWGALNILSRKGVVSGDDVVNAVIFNEPAVQVIADSFHQGHAHTNPFRPKKGRRNTRNRRNRNRSRRHRTRRA